MKSINVVVLLIGTDIPGGAERRIASFMSYIRDVPDLNMTLVVNGELLNQLVKTETKPLCRVITLQSWYFESFFNNAIRQSPKNILIKFFKRLFKITSNIFLCLQLGIYLLFNKTDLIQLVLGGARTIAFPFLVFTRSTVVGSVVGSEVRAFAAMWVLDQYILKWCLKKAHVIDALSEELYDLLIQKELAEDSKIRISGSFVDTEKYSPFPEKKPWVVFAARLIDEKNPLLFLDVIPRILADMGSQVRFFMLGTGKLEALINERIGKYGLEDFVTIGFYSQVVEVLSGSMVFCSLQEHENYPSRSLLEAMSCGNAIVATDVGYTYKLVNEFTGTRVSFSPDDVASAIIDLLKNTANTLEMGRRARKLVMDDYSPEAYCRKMQDIYWEAYRINNSRMKLFE